MYFYELKAFVESKLFEKNISVSSNDMLPCRIKLPAGFIVNLSSSNEPGSHWVALWINEKRLCYYFDSYGFPPRTKEISKFIALHSREVVYNMRQLQQLHSKTCGNYAACFYIMYQTVLIYKYF